ncbi:uncharacterized protein LOC116946560 [Petromyzon marinus]|uniref:uncharacterized protein LOC116946560 n=1 Tax=Petromyzon marinus TaxID=7757 RepID=UPI003F7010BC
MGDSNQYVDGPGQVGPTAQLDRGLASAAVAGMVSVGPYVEMSEVIYAQLHQMAYTSIESTPTGQGQQAVEEQQQQEGSTENECLEETFVATQGQQDQQQVVAPAQGNAFQAGVQQQGHMDFHDLKAMLMNEPPPAHNAEMPQHHQHRHHHQQEQQQLLVVHSMEKHPEMQVHEVESSRLLDLTTVGPRDTEDETNLEARGGGTVRCQAPQGATGVRVRLEDRFAENSSSSRDLMCEKFLSAQREQRGPALEHSNLVPVAHHLAEYCGQQTLEQQHQQQLHSDPIIGKVVSGPSSSVVQFVFPGYKQHKCFPDSAKMVLPPQNIPTEQLLESLHMKFNQGLEAPMHMGSLAPPVFRTDKHPSTQPRRSQEELEKELPNVFNEAKVQPKRHLDRSERKTLGDISNKMRGQAPSKSSYASTASQPEDGNYKRVRHNLMERDRRRRIRICCDELNYLVPFCNVETDKATTLQWSVTFLKYIQENHGKHLKQEFESMFCNKAEQSIKPKETSKVSEEMMAPHTTH